MEWIESDTWAPFHKHGLTLISAWISNYIHYNVWDEITNPFLNFNGATVEVQEFYSILFFISNIFIQGNSIQ